MLDRSDSWTYLLLFLVYFYKIYLWYSCVLHAWPTAAIIWYPIKSNNDINTFEAVDRVTHLHRTETEHFYFLFSTWVIYLVYLPTRQSRTVLNARSSPYTYVGVFDPERCYMVSLCDATESLKKRKFKYIIRKTITNRIPESTHHR